MKTPKRQYMFKNHATKIRIRRYGSLFYFVEAHLEGGCLPAQPETGLSKTYEECVKKMQRYSRRYYGEEAV